MASEDALNILPGRENCVYTKCYCEENIWKLCDYVKEVAPQRLRNLHVIFISNKDRRVPIWNQRARREECPYVIWDYHVILLYQEGHQNNIYDMDTLLPYPCDLKTYICEAIGSEEEITSEFHRFFRVISANDYLEHFASDRSHMKKEDGTWMSGPPTYGPIKSKDSSHNLDDFISMEPNHGWGNVYSLSQLVEKFISTEVRLVSLLSRPT